MSKYKMPWLRKRKKTDPELPLQPPIHLGPFSNGEVFFEPGPQERLIRKLILEKAEEGAKRHGIDRREFLASSMGMATSLWAINLVTGCSSSDGGGTSAGGGGAGAGSGGFAPGPSGGTPGGGGMPAGGAFGTGGTSGNSGGQFGSGGAGAGGAMSGNGAAGSGGSGTGGSFVVPTDPTDPDKVCEVMIDASKEFVFDIQTHHVNRADTAYEDFLKGQQQFTSYCGPKGMGTVSCFSRNEYVRLMFLESDTTVAVLSGLPAATEPGNPVTNDEIAQSMEAINMMADGTQRLVNHHMVLPNKTGKAKADVDFQLDEMQRVKEKFGKIGAWKCYPAWSPQNTNTVANDGWWMDDEATGLRFVQKGVELGVPLFCIHKGLPIPAFSANYLNPVDIGRVAKLFPQANFVVYHSGYGNQNNYNEGPYTEGAINGTNSLVTSLISAGIGPNQNVYAELGTTWQLVSTLAFVGGPTAAAHVLGKLLKYVGENNVVWGTDSIWYGSPQRQIETFLQFEISPQFQQQYGYPALTMDVKRKILGLNAARIYGIDHEKVRCGIDKSEVSMIKQQLDHDLGARRWAFDQPMLHTRRDFWRLFKQSGFRPG
jgi:predicted TIM-barrel fold metal-dependent hydrolase